MAQKETFTFLVTTDNHMGYKQDDHIRRKDSFMAFAEALQIARDRDVDFILLGGDLFHINKPSNNVEHKCIKIIRQHMTSKIDKQTSFKRVSGQLSHFERLKHANFEDPNLKIQCPIFTIHGNHDDPTGPTAKSICEKLATCGLLNYFGLVQPHEDGSLVVEPVVIQKGAIKLALYGLGFIPDLKLRQAFEDNRVHFQEPASDTFNILIVHQNRVPHDKSKFIPDSLFPSFFHLIIRGHEHSTQSPEKIPDSKVGGMVYQPGSTVATSVSVMESGAKRVSVMAVSLKDPAGEPANRFGLDYELVPLKCCRPMLLRDVSRKEVCKYVRSKDSRKELTPIEYKCLFKEFIVDYIERLLAEFARESKGESSGRGRAYEEETDVSSMDTDETVAREEEPPLDGQVVGASASIYQKLHRLGLPLVRLRLEYVNKAERFDENDIGSLFHPKRAANRDIILFKRQKLLCRDDGQTENVTFAMEDADEEAADMDDVEVINLSEERKDTIDTMIEQYFLDRPPSEQLRVLSIQEYVNAVRSAAEDGNVISKVLRKKEDEVLRSYGKEVGDEDHALAHFHADARVREYLLATFQRSAVSLPKQGGDQYEIALEAAMAMQEEEDSDIEWED